MNNNLDSASKSGYWREGQSSLRSLCLICIEHAATMPSKPQALANASASVQVTFHGTPDEWVAQQPIAVSDASSHGHLPK